MRSQDKVMLHCVQKTPKSQALSVQVKPPYFLKGCHMDILKYKRNFDSVEGKNNDFVGKFEQGSPVPFHLA